MPVMLGHFPLLSPEQANPIGHGFNQFMDAMSKRAYANLMGPQFISKLIGNENILSQIKDPAAKQIIERLLGAGMMNTGRATGHNIFGDMFSGIGNLFSGTGGGLNNPAMPSTITSYGNNTGNAGSSVLGRIPEENRRINALQPGQYYQAPNIQQQNSIMKREKKIAENIGEFKGLKSEGEEAGKQRAKDIAEFGKQIEAGKRLGDKFNNMTSLINNPVYANMKKRFPAFQRMQIAALKRFGNPAEKELLGQFTNTADEIVRDTMNTFSGNKMKGEFDISREMKPSDNDNLDVQVGKVQSAMIFKEFGMQRAQLASDIMEDLHISKSRALKMADAQLDGDRIRAEIQDRLDYTVQIRKKNPDGTYEVKQVKKSEARRMGVPNV